jgi:DNA ligase (NAD+)
LRSEADAANPRARSNKDNSPLEKQQLAARHAELLAEANAAGHRLIEAGFAELGKKKGATDADAVTAIGPVTAQATLDWFASEIGRQTLRRLQELGIAPAGGMSRSDQPFAGKTFVLTGTLEKMSRSEAAEKLRALGGNVSSSVSRKTHFVIAGPGAGSKLDEARALGVVVLDESQFIEMLMQSRKTAPSSQSDLFSA